MTFKFEKAKIKQGYQFVVGCDEVGRGCLAGPVVAAAVVLPQVESKKWKVVKSCGIKDSKKLTAAKREVISKIIKDNCLWSIAEVSPKEIDSINIHNASLLAMKKAVERLRGQSECSIPEALSAPAFRLCSKRPERSRMGERLSGIQSEQSSGSRLSDALGRDGKIFLFVDGKFTVPNLSISQQSVIGGDNKVFSIAAASIIAKVYRDNLMREFDKQYPAYELAKHKGYATLQHRKMIIKNGLSPIHRLTFCEQYLGT